MPNKPFIVLANGEKLYNPFEDIKKHPEHKKLEAEAMARVRLAKKLYEQRTKKKFSQAALAKKAGTTPAVICRIEGAEVSVGLGLACRLFRALGQKELRLSI